MFYHDGGHLQHPVRVDTPNPVFARALQQAIGGVEGEIRVCLQYLFQAFGARGPSRYRDMLLETGTEEIGHIEMLCTAVALNLEGAPLEMEKAARNPLIHATLGGMNFRHVLSTVLAAMPVDSQGVPFDCSHVYASGNTAADMLANVTAESTGRMLACQLFRMTDDQGMRDMLRFLIARDTMHQNQFLAAWEELGGPRNHPIPNSFPQELELGDVAYTFMSTGADGVPVPEGAWSSGQSFDGRALHTVQKMRPADGIPALSFAPHNTAAQASQMAALDEVLDAVNP